MLQKFVPVLLCLLLSCFISRSQDRLELLETNIPENDMATYGDSYLWTKNWWLSTGMLVPVEKGGNALASSSKLNKARLDSLSRLFNTYLSPKLLRRGNLKPRIVYVKDKRAPFIQTTVFEIDGEEVKAIGQFKITFFNAMHNQMPDVQDIEITPVDKIRPHDKATVLKTYKRTATSIEKEITPPEVQGIE